MKTKIEKYNVGGKVHIWRYKDNHKNYPDWNILLDKVANESVLELLNLMSACEWSTQKTIKTEFPIPIHLNIVNNHNELVKKSKSTLTLYCKVNEAEDYWKILELEDKIEIHFGKKKLVALQNVIKSILKGKRDFTISDDNDHSILCFW